jgi:hypothetical protein
MPIDVATLLAPRLAQMLLEPPRWQVISRKFALPVSSRIRSATNRWLAP